MILSCLAFCLVVSVVSGGSSYQYVRFISKPERSGVAPATVRPNVLGSKQRSSRSYHFPVEYYEYAEDVWPESLFLNNDNFLDVSLGEHGDHYTPDFSNGLAYPDPILLTGLAAKRAVSYLYGKGELFYHNFPHTRAILNLQQQRKLNGLPPNRLGSLDNASPFYRDKQRNRY